MARELAPAGARSGPVLKGLLRSPTGASSLATRIVDGQPQLIQIAEEGSDGFNVMFPSLPGGLDDVFDEGVIGKGGALHPSFRFKSYSLTSMNSSAQAT